MRALRFRVWRGRMPQPARAPTGGAVQIAVQITERRHVAAASILAAGVSAVGIAKSRVRAADVPHVPGYQRAYQPAVNLPCCHCQALQAFGISQNHVAKHLANHAPSGFLARGRLLWRQRSAAWLARVDRSAMRSIRDRAAKRRASSSVFARGFDRHAHPGVSHASLTAACSDCSAAGPARVPGRNLEPAPWTNPPPPFCGTELPGCRRISMR